MSTTTPRARRRTTTSALVAVAIALIGAAPAAAAPTIDPAAEANLYIHKFAQPTQIGTEATGLEIATTGLTPLPGIEFQVQKVPGVDLATNDGWAAAAGFTVATATTAVAAVTPTRVTTDLNGNAPFTGLDLGLYLVRENLSPAQVAGGITGAAPFLVTLPLTDPAKRDAWLYDVHVYPKNSLDSITKTVSDADATTLGDTVTWTIEAGIPGGGPTDRFEIVDVLDPRLTYTPSAVVSVVDADAAPNVVTAGTDYSVTHAAGTVTVTFTPAGRTQLAAIVGANEGAKIRVVVATTVTAIGGANGTIANSATLYPNLTSLGVTSTPVETRWGNVTIRKTDLGSGNLAGAVFELFPTLTDARARTNAISVGAASSWTSGADGTVTISGLRYTGWQNGATVTDAPLYLVETAAPEGYELLAEPVAVSIDGVDTVVDVVVKNAPRNGGFKLPLTGGAGTVAFSVVGLLLVGAGALLVNRSRGARARR